MCFSVLLCVKMNGFTLNEYAWQTSKELQTPSLLFSHRFRRWTLNVETDVGLQMWFPLTGRVFWLMKVTMTLFQLKKTKKRLQFMVRSSMLSVSPILNIAVVTFPTLLN